MAKDKSEPRSSVKRRWKQQKLPRLKVISQLVVATSRIPWSGRKGATAQNTGKITRPI